MTKIIILKYEEEKLNNLIPLAYNYFTKSIFHIAHEKITDKLIINLVYLLKKEKKYGCKSKLGSIVDAILDRITIIYPNKSDN